MALRIKTDPYFWINFLKHVDDTVNRGGHNSYAARAWVNTRNEVLAQYSAKLIIDDGGSKLEFDREENATLFILRWS